MSGSQDWKPKGNPWLIALVVTLAAFMEILDTTIVNVALPHIAGALSSSNDEATWTLTSYLVANGIVLPISGFLGNRIGRKRYFLICIGMFGVCSLLCGLAQSLPMLILSRLAQGFFGGGLQPNQQSIILDTFPPEKRGMAFSITAIATIVAPVLGPTLGGWITDNYSWRWIFFINIPVAILTFFSVSALVEDPPWVKDEPKRGIDSIGLGLIALGLGSMQVVMDRGEDADWFGSEFICIMTGLAAIGLLGAIAWLLSVKKPIVNLRVMGDRNFALGSFMTFMLFGIVYSSAVLIPQLAQEVLNYNSTLAGLVLSPGALLVCLTIPAVQFAMGHVKTKYIVAIGFVVIGAGLSYSMTITPTIDYDTLAKMRAAQSLGIALLFVPISTLAYATLPKTLNGDAAALYTMFRNVSGSIGISLATAMVTERTQVRTAYLGGHLNPFNENYQQLLQRNAHALLGMGRAAGETMQVAKGMVYTTLRTQAQVLAYSDVVMYCAVGAFCVVPFAFLFSGIKAKKGGGGGH
jgi:DHA2 family multidrug resistance protein